jgi:uncharacterized repeat protein (TIGR03806 family)
VAISAILLTSTPFVPSDAMSRSLVFASGLLGLALALVGIRPPQAEADHPIPKPLKAPLPTKFECRWADTPIVLDGSADDLAWKQAQEISTFHLPWLGDQARLSRTATRARLLWDREYLYFFAEMDDSDLFADITDHDGMLWLNDVFELFVRPDAEQTGYYEFELNAAGAVFDAFFPKFDEPAILKQSTIGRFHIDAKVKLRGTLNRRDDVDQGWSIEGRIPWTDFIRTGGRPEPGESWRFNLCRFDYHKDWNEPEISCIAPIAKRTIAPFFHQIDDFATITFVGPDRTTARPFGIEAREPLTTSRVIGFPEPPPPYRVKRVLPELKLDFPIMARSIPGSTDLLVITQPYAYGPTTISRFKFDPASQDLVKLFETPHQGTAYDLAFHPQFADNGYVYIGWNGGPAGQPKQSRITRYTMRRTPPFDLDTTTATTIIAWESDGHNGAALCFGSDGMLYVTSGDGTSDSDTNLTGQRTDLLLAKVLRIDVDRPATGKGYSVPRDNPFVSDPRFAPETWAYGLRNPWRISFDAQTGQLWVGNNGQDLWEQAYLVQKGANYGWSVMEGSHPFYRTRQAGPTPFTNPTIEHHHSEARSLTGGVVYQGKRFRDLQGAYIYGDYSTGRIWGVRHDGTKIIWHKLLAVTTLKITAFTFDPNGELLICHHAPSGDGGLFTLEPNPEPANSTFPRKLSESGLFDSVKDHRFKASVIPYSVNAPFWSDGLYKERGIAVPAGKTIGFTRSRGWQFPDQAVLVKSFALEQTEGDPTSRRWIETRFLTKQFGEWYGYSYVWNEAGTDATLVDAVGLDREFTIQTATGPRRQIWRYPSRAECMVCHSRAQNFVLGLCELQMNKDHVYPSGRTDNQLRVLEHLGLLKVDWYDLVRGSIEDSTNKPQPQQRGPKPSGLLPAPPAALQRLVDPYDASQDLNRRARSWLHANCSSCHVEAGGGNARMELEFTTPLEKMRLVKEKPVHQTFELPNTRLVTPGHPERSVLVHRVGLRGPGQMPPLASTRPDQAGMALLSEWVKNLKP